MGSSPFTKPLHYIYEHFKKDTSKMLIATGTIGWVLSSAAQVLAVLCNSKISNEQKGYIVPQEMLDAAINIATFLGITLITKKTIAKLVSTGKIVPENVRNYLNKNKDLYEHRIGKMDFDLDEVLKSDKQKFPVNSYYKFKNYATTLGTVVASVFATNIVTPVATNIMASKVQKRYLEKRPQISNNRIYTNSGNMKI